MTQKMAVSLLLVMAMTQYPFCLALPNYNSSSAFLFQLGNIELTKTGFYYPLGRANFDSKCGKWQARDTDPKNRLKRGDCYFQGLYHIGVDMMANEGASVYAIADGIVFAPPFDDGEGNDVVYIKHTLKDGTQFLALYAHIKTNVKINQKVDAGKPFATVGSYTSGDHLHFSIRSELKAAPTKSAKDAQGNTVKIGWGRGSNYFWPDTNGFVEPIELITTKYPQAGSQPTVRPPVTKSLLPPSIQEFMDAKYPGWKLAEPSKEDRTICFDKSSGFQPSLIWADFNGDKQRDYAIQIVHRQKVRLLAFLNQGASYNNYDLAADPMGGTIPVLSVAKRGEKYFDHEKNRNGIFPFDTITAAYCESSAVSYIFRAGRFVKVFISD